jgi:CheY-like chemotaxis protein
MMIKVWSIQYRGFYSLRTFMIRKLPTMGLKLVKKFITHKPDLIILDIRMPRVDGYKLCAAIRNSPENKNVKILIISGLNESTRSSQT